MEWSFSIRRLIPKASRPLTYPVFAQLESMLLCIFLTANSHFSRRDYIEGCKRREYFHLDDPGGISIIVTATDSQLDADGCDSALHEPMPDSQALLFPRCRFGR